MAVTLQDDGLTFPVRVVPRAKRDRVAGVEGGILKVRVTAPPVGGKASRAVIKVLADRLAVSRSQVEIISGQRTRRKVVKVAGVSEAEVMRRLDV